MKKVYVVLEVKRKGTEAVGINTIAVFNKRKDAEAEALKHNPFDTKIIESTIQ